MAPMSRSASSSSSSSPARSGGAISTRNGAASSPAGEAATRPSRSWASTGTSSIWSGSSSSHSSICGEVVMNETTAHSHIQSGQQLQTGQQHPIRLYLLVWGLLFVLSAFSYMVDYLGLQGYLRWT